MSEDNMAAVDLSGRTILITSAGDGLGAATARAAGQAGAEVILLGRSVRKLEQVYDDIVAAGGPDPGIIPLDLEGATPDDFADIADRIEAQCGRLHALVHNAAITGPLTSIAQYPPLEWIRVMQVNLNAPMLLTQACLPLLHHTDAPAIVFIGDERRQAFWGAYGVAKTGLAGLADILREELDGRVPMRVETLYPGPMRTGLRANAFPGALATEAPPVDHAVVQVMARLAPSASST